MAFAFEIIGKGVRQMKVGLFLRSADKGRKPHIKKKKLGVKMEWLMIPIARRLLSARSRIQVNREQHFEFLFGIVV